MPRRFIRHATSIPIQLCTSEMASPSDEQYMTKDVSAGGLSCVSDQLLSPGSLVEVEIFVEKPPFKTMGHVVWCRKAADEYLVGIGFSDVATAYAVRMVEQVCHIEEYRQNVLRSECRELTSEEAALEWIAKNAADFPQNVH